MTKLIAKLKTQPWLTAAIVGLSTILSIAIWGVPGAQRTAQPSETESSDASQVGLPESNNLLESSEHGSVVRLQPVAGAMG